MPGTLALVFLLWGAAPAPDQPPNYTRSVLTPGEQRYTLPQGVPDREFHIAENRLQQGYLPQGGVPVGTDYSTLPAKTMTGCLSYLKTHGQYFEEAAESMGKVIQDARCMMIPNGKMLGQFHDGGYGENGERANAFSLVEVPQEPKMEGPICANIRPEYPKVAQEELAPSDSWDATVQEECISTKGGDGYWHPHSCRAISVKSEKGYEKPFLNSADTYLKEACFKDLGATTPTPGHNIYTVSYTAGAEGGQ